MIKSKGCVIIFLAVLLSSCSNFIPFQDLNTLNTLYTTSASIQSHAITSFSIADKSGTVCIPSRTETAIEFTLINPYPFVLTMTPVSSAVFTSAPVMSHSGDDLTRAVLYFTLDESEEFKTVDFVVNLQSEDGLRSFTSYSFSVFCNSMPTEASSIGKSFSPESNICVFYGNLPSQPSDTDITDAEITYYEAGTTNLAGTATINPHDVQYKQRPDGIPDSFVHTDYAFYYNVPDSTADYDWGITLIDSAGLRSASVFTTPLLLSALPAVTAHYNTGTYYIADPAAGFNVEFTSSAEDSIIEYRTRQGGGEFGDWQSSGESTYTHNFPVGETVIELRAYKQLYPYSPVASFTYTVIPENVVGFTIPDIADTDVSIALTAYNPDDDSEIPLSDGSYAVPPTAHGIRIAAAPSPAGTYTYTWTLYNADGTVNGTAVSSITGNTATYSGIPSGFYSLIVIAEDADGNAGMEFVPLYTAY